jgi:hypothetical protein
MKIKEVSFIFHVFTLFLQNRDDEKWLLEKIEKNKKVYIKPVKEEKGRMI